MSHLAILPVLIPLLAGSLLLVLRRLGTGSQFALSLASVVAQLLAALALGQATADGTVLAYLVGDWVAPFGIALAVDRLTVIMLILSGVVATASVIGSRDGPGRGPGFHALFQFQLFGLNGAFLTADLFNLFVFFEVLLAASYGLLLSGEGPDRFRAATHYVVINLIASSLFLVAASLFYGLAGTLSLADLAVRLPGLPTGDAGLVQTAGFLLLVVFAVKAALLPLGFWLPLTYRSAPLPVATLFVIMTKVGVYATARIVTLLFGANGGPLSSLPGEALVFPGLATLLFAGLGAVGATHLRSLASWLVMASAGTLLAAVGLATEDALAGALFYLMQATLAAAAMFCVTALVSAARGPLADELRPGPRWQSLSVTAPLFLAVAVAVTGLPPLAGFVAKALLIQAALATDHSIAFISVLVTSALLTLLAVLRSGTTLFWSGGGPPGRDPVTGPAAGQVTASLLLLGLCVALAVAPLPAQRYAAAAAAQLRQPSGYIRSVLGQQAIGPAAGSTAAVE